MRCVVEIEKSRSPPSFERVGRAELHRPARPRRDVVGPRRGGSPSELDLRDGCRALAVRVRDAVRAGVAAADHDHVLPGRADRAAPCRRSRARGRRGTPSRSARPSSSRPGDRQVARHARRRSRARPRRGRLAARRVEVESTSTPNRNSTPSATQLVDAALDEALLDLELRHAEADEPAGRLVALVDDDVLTGARELLRAREPGGAGSDDGDAAAGARARRLRDDPAFVPGAIDDRALDLLDRDRVALLDLEHARRLARRRAEPAGELGEVVRAVQLVDRLAPAVAIDEVVPVGDQVPERAAAVAERHAALHAAGRLLAQLGQRQRADELAHVADALARVALGRLDARRPS